MDEHDPRELAQSAWEMIAAGDWEAAGELIHDDYVQEWPQSGERIVGKDNAFAVNKNFPGGLPKMTFRRVLTGGELVVMEVLLDYPDGSVFNGVSIMEIRDGKITKETDYFAQPFQAPQWRAQWGERF